jgi:glycosyltransferase involved in cell wall biosynthesis
MPKRNRNRAPSLIAIPAEGLREGRTGGQLLWQRLVDRLKAAGLSILCEDERPIPRWLRDRPFALVFWYWFAYGGIHRGVVVADQSSHGRLALLLRRLGRRPRIRLVVVVQHLREGFRYGNELYVNAARRNENTVIRLADTIVVHTEEEARLVRERGADPDRIRIIPVGIWHVDHRIEIRQLEEKEPLRLFWLGGDFERKGLDTLLQAMAICKGTRPLLQIVGLPHDRSILEKAKRRADSLGLSGLVSFLGRLSEEDLEVTWGRNDVYVQPSLHEGHGSALDEALIRGMPAIVSDLPVFRQRLEEEDVIFVPKGDVGALARALEDARSISRREELAGRGHARARKFPSWEETFDAYETLIRSELDRIP